MAGAIAAAMLATGAGASAVAPTGAGYELERARVAPQHAYLDGERRIRLRYSFSARRKVDLVIKVVNLRTGDPVRRWTERDVAPGRVHRRRWDGRRADGGVPADGRYAFRVGPPGHRGALAGRFRFADHRFPVDGPYSYGDRFGEPRSGGRVHEGQDLPSPCGTRLVAARGGRVQARGYSDALYGHWVLIDGVATQQDYFYSHLEQATTRADGARVRTGATIGRVGKSGNARSEFCQLHFELWPHGYRNGSPVDPIGPLRRWDRRS